MRVHIVQKGDTLWKIAKQYAVGFEELKRLNAHLTNPDYIVPGMEIYLPDTMSSKEKEVKQQTVVKEQPKPVKEAPMSPVKEVPVKPPVIQPKPIWQGDMYFQQAPQPMPMPTPNWQHINFQPTIEQSVVAPAPQPVQMPQQPIIIQQPAPQPPVQMPQMMPQQPIFIQQPVPQPQQPIFIEQPMMQPQYYPHMMHPMPICSHCHGVKMDHQMYPMQEMHPMHSMPICSHCHGMKMDHQMYPMHPMQTLPANIDESPEMQVQPCSDRQQQVDDYYNQIQHMMMMSQPCCQPMMPYPMQMMPQMNPIQHQPKSCH